MKRILLAIGLLGIGCAVKDKQPEATLVDKWQRTKDCAAQAEIDFTHLGYSHSAEAKTMASYTSHYNPDREMCFVLVDSLLANPTNIMTFHSLEDAFEGKIYASYIANLRTPKDGASNLHLVDCYVLSSDGTKRQCKDEDEFQALVKPYMEAVSEAAVAKGKK